MFQTIKNPRNYLNSNNLIIKSMFKRRKLALSAIAQVTDRKQAIRLVK